MCGNNPLFAFYSPKMRLFVQIYISMNFSAPSGHNERVVERVAAIFKKLNAKSEYFPYNFKNHNSFFDFIRELSNQFWNFKTNSCAHWCAELNGTILAPIGSKLSEKNAKTKNPAKSKITAIFRLLFVHFVIYVRSSATILDRQNIPDMIEAFLCWLDEYSQKLTRESGKSPHKSKITVTFCILFVQIISF